MSKDSKQCSKCGEDKPFSSFYKDPRLSDGLRTDCKDCFSQKGKQKYANDESFRNKVLERNKKYQNAQRQEYYLLVIKHLKESGCVDCGEKDPIVLDHDHVRGQKKDGISQMVRNHAPWKEIEEEMAKCEVRCSNCHRRKTAKERGYWKKFDLSSI